VKTYEIKKSTLRNDLETITAVFDDFSRNLFDGEEWETVCGELHSLIGFFCGDGLGGTFVASLDVDPDEQDANHCTSIARCIERLSDDAKKFIFRDGGDADRVIKWSKRYSKLALLHKETPQQTLRIDVEIDVAVELIELSRRYLSIKLSSHKGSVLHNLYCMVVARIWADPIGENACSNRLDQALSSTK
jgi:hypothetical protein